ncbi:MAG: NAD(P)H-dependent oxidoreductase subunit E [Thermoplasmata archaeon]
MAATCAAPTHGIPKTVDKILGKYNSDKKWLISILFDMQNEFRYLPREALQYLSKKLDVPMTDVYSIATFYKAFSLTPKGKHSVTVCMGTACHVRGSLSVLEEFERQLEVRPGGTTPDKMFSMSTVSCLGCCAMGPIAVVDEKYHGQVSANKVKPLLDAVRKADAGTAAKKAA